MARRTSKPEPTERELFDAALRADDPTVTEAELETAWRSHNATRYAEYAVRAAEFSKKGAAETISEIATRLRRKADDIERDGARIFDVETQFSSYEVRAERIIHELIWLMPNLPVESLFRYVREVRQYSKEAK